MHARSLARALGAAAALLTLAAGAAGAQGKGKAQGGKAKSESQGDAKGGAKAHSGSGVAVEVSRGGQQPNARGNGTPPGLAKKPGGMPPGQYKKRYRPDDGVVILRDVFRREGYTVVRVEVSGDRRFVFYRLRSGPVQRVVVSPGAADAQRPTITNAPSSVVGKVLARMQ
jgi:hypothetical protein